MAPFLIAYDVGSTGCKTCAYELGSSLRLVGSGLSGYRIATLPNGGAEQDPEDWWRAMRAGTAAAMAEAKLRPGDIAGISFCAQMQGLVLVDRSLRAVRPAMSYMDQRSGRQQSALFGRGPRIEGVPVGKLLRSLRINGAVAASVKDPVWKYLWVRDNEPEIFARVHRWLDVKDYLIARATGRATMTRDSAFATFLTDERKSPSAWSPELVRMYGVEAAHLPELIDATEQAGLLLPEAASELGLVPGIPVFGGGGDASMIAVGSGSTREGDAYVYTGTSGWVSTTVRTRKIDVSRHVAAIVGAQRGLYNYFGEQETAGKCLEWVRDHLALDEIGVFLEKKSVADDLESKHRSLYDFLFEAVEAVPAGSGGVIFCPWLHGNRSPFEDPDARGIFFNLALDTGKRMMIKAVVEGIAYHQKWLLESISKSFPVRGPIRFVGGGALSTTAAQILADIFELPVETTEHPQNCGAAGAALTAAAGLGLIGDLESARRLVAAERTFEPNPANAPAYRKQFAVFKDLYTANRKLFARLRSAKERP